MNAFDDRLVDLVTTALALFFARVMDGDYASVSDIAPTPTTPNKPGNPKP